MSLGRYPQARSCRVVLLVLPEGFEEVDGQPANSENESGNENNCAPIEGAVWVFEDVHTVLHSAHLCACSIYTKLYLIVNKNTSGRNCRR